MDYILILNNGIGNKVLILINMLYRYPKYNFFLIDRTSHHQEGNVEEKLWNLFPDLLKHPRLKFIRWSSYDSLKETVPEMKYHWEIFYDIKGFVPSVKKYFHASQEFAYMEDRLDFKKGIFVHVRLGDKIKENIQALQSGKGLRFVIMKPEYYQDYILKLRKKDEPVYIFSDDLVLAEKLLPGYEYPDLTVNETYYCFQNARRVIISESSLTISAVLLSKKKKDLVVPNFFLEPNFSGKNFKLIKSPYFSDGESNKKYIFTELKDFERLNKLRM